MQTFFLYVRYPSLLSDVQRSWQRDEPCVTNEKQCNICSGFTEEQLIKIKHRCRYVRKQKVSDTCNTSKDDDLDLLGDDVEAFSGSPADLAGAAENLFSSPRPKPLRFESFLRIPQTFPPTPGTALQNKIESKLEKSLGNQFSIELQQQMGVFQASMLEGMESLREEIQSMKKASASTSKAGPSKQPDLIIHPNPRKSDPSDAQPLETDFCCPSLPAQFTQSVQSDHGSKHSDLQPEHADPEFKHSEQPKRVCSTKVSSLFCQRAQ